MALYNLKCGAEFEQCDVALMEQHVLRCHYCQHGFEGGNPNDCIPSRPFMTGQLRASSVSIVETPVDPNCKTSDGRYIAIDWERKVALASKERN